MNTDNRSEVREGTKDERTEHRDDRLAIFYITRPGFTLAERVADLYPHGEIEKFSMHAFSEKWKSAKYIICIMATGIVVRAAAPLVKDKKKDPAVVVIDEKGRYAISLLSGHIGGANNLASEIADYLGAQAVITTASDVQGKLSLDLWAVEHNLYVDDYAKLRTLSAKIVNGQKVTLLQDCPREAECLPEEFTVVDSVEDADMIISEKIIDQEALFLRPKNLFAGIGCNRRTAKEEIAEVFKSVLSEEKLSVHSVRSIASIDLKKDEQGLLGFAHDARLPVEFFSKEALNNAAMKYNIEGSNAVRSATGAVAVSEPAAILGAMKICGDVSIVRPKEKRGNVTLAIAKAKFTL